MLFYKTAGYLAFLPLISPRIWENPAAKPSVLGQNNKKINQINI